MVILLISVFRHNVQAAISSASEALPSMGTDLVVR